MLDCPDLAVPQEVMQHVVHVESSRNPFAIGVVGGYLAHQPNNLEEALATVRDLKAEGYNFSVGIAQVNRYNLAKYGLRTYAEAFDACSNLQAGARILRECYDRAQDWGKAFSCYYSGNFSTGFEHGYVQKIFASIRRASYQQEAQASNGIRVIPYRSDGVKKTARDDGLPLRKGKPELSKAPAASDYPEPYAIRKYLPQVPLSVMARAMSNARQAPSKPTTDLDTAEMRPAIPVPGPGALTPSTAVAGNTTRNALSQIPTQVVGVDGDPYKTRIVASGTAGLPANRLPLPDPNTALPQTGATGPKTGDQAQRSSGAPVATRRGGHLLNSNESSGKPGKSSDDLQRGVAGVNREGNEVPLDKSFVF